LATLVALGLLAGGCSSTTEVPDAGDAGVALPATPVAPIDACQQLALALGNLELRCNRMTRDDATRYEASLCPAERVAAETADFLAKKSAYDTNGVGCVTSYRTMQACNALVDSDTGCGLVGWGIQGVGQPCSTAISCAPGLWCKRSVANSACGTCTAVPVQGDPCGPLAQNAPCGSGTCDGISCVPVAGLGQMCAPESIACAPGLVCQSAGCAQPGNVGVNCLFDSDCADGLFCDPGSGKCATRAQPVGDCTTQECVLGFGCGFAAPVVDGGTDGGIDAGNPTCLPLGGMGQACVYAAGGGLCKEAETCGSDGKCAPIPALGDLCDGGACLAGICQSGSCSLSAGGGTCGQNIDCVSSICVAASMPTCASTCMP
jgi:hypothetical protein